MKQKWVILFLFCLLTSCAQRQVNLATIDTTNLAQLESVMVAPITSAGASPEISNLRLNSLRESAMTTGAQGGLAWAAEKMNARMRADGSYLDTIYNFSGMVLSHGVIPPVLVEGDYTLNLADPDTIRVSDRTYKIVKQARFATTPPNWREYLWFGFVKPELPDRTLLPRCREEQRVWREGVRLGWEKGIQQGYNIFQQNMARLKRDFAGMILYRKLLQQNMINPPFVARTELGITGNGTSMRINDQVLRIVEHPQLQTSGKNWRAVVVKKCGPGPCPS